MPGKASEWARGVARIKKTKEYKNLSPEEQQRINKLASGIYRQFKSAEPIAATTEGTTTPAQETSTLARGVNAGTDILESLGRSLGAGTGALLAAPPSLAAHGIESIARLKNLAGIPFARKKVREMLGIEKPQPEPGTYDALQRYATTLDVGARDIRNIFRKTFSPAQNSFFEIKTPKDAAVWLSGVVGETAPLMLATAGTAGSLEAAGVPSVIAELLSSTGFFGIPTLRQQDVERNGKIGTGEPLKELLLGTAYGAVENLAGVTPLKLAKILKLGKGAGKSGVSSRLWSYLRSSAGEGGEEGVQQIMETFNKHYTGKTTLANALKNTWKEMQTAEWQRQAGEQMAGGLVVGLGFGSPEITAGIARDRAAAKLRFARRQRDEATKARRVKDSTTTRKDEAKAAAAAMAAEAEAKSTIIEPPSDVVTPPYSPVAGLLPAPDFPMVPIGNAADVPLFSEVGLAGFPDSVRPAQMEPTGAGVSFPKPRSAPPRDLLSISADRARGVLPEISVNLPPPTAPLEPTGATVSFGGEKERLVGRGPKKEKRLLIRSSEIPGEKKLPPSPIRKIPASAEGEPKRPKKVTAAYRVGSYNTRRYSKPWIAKIISWGEKSKYPEIDFGISSEEEAVIDVAPGEVVRYGQKDYRGRGTVAKYGIAQDDGSIKEVSLSDAKRAWNDRMARRAETKKRSEPHPSPQTEKGPTPENSESLGKMFGNRLIARGEVSWRDLFAMANEAFGGTMAEGVYSPKDAYDAVELYLNKKVAESKFPEGETRKAFSENIDALSKAMNAVPTQTKRSAETDEFQQFSTPPPLAYLVSWLGNVSKNDLVLEPSAGIGGLAAFAKSIGAKVVANELSARRRGLLGLLGLKKITGENAEHINAVNALKEISPSLVLMNPPFSATAGRMQGKRDPAMGLKHVSSALAKLKPGGRLVVILGKGQGTKAKSRTIARVWGKIRENNTIRLDMAVSGSEYRKYGTSFGNRVVVVDKIPPSSDHTIRVIDDPVKIADIGNNEQLFSSLKEVRNVRPPTESLGKETIPMVKKEQKVPGIRTSSSPTVGGGGKQRNTRSVGNDVTRAVAAKEEGKRKEPVQPVREKVAMEGRPSDTGRPDTEGVRGELGRQGEHDLQSAIMDEDKGRGEKRSGKQIERTGGKRKREEGSLFAKYVSPGILIENPQEHPTPLVETASMADVPSPKIAYKPDIPKRVVQSGALSHPQLVFISLAGQAHQEILPGGKRKGIMSGDGTGVGKGREISGIIIDNWRRGRKKAIWITKNQDLLRSAKRDLSALGVKDERVFELTSYDEINRDSGILLMTFGSLRSQQKKAEGKRRIDQIISWVGKDFDGVLAFDEAHAMNNSLPGKGPKKSSKTALVGVEIQEKLPQARVVYVTATPATEVSHIVFADRLGLWGPGTPFPTKAEFVARIGAGGLSAMEIVSRDAKAMGSYLSRSLSMDGVNTEIVEHQITKNQKDTYDRLARAWQMVMGDAITSLDETNAGGFARARFMNSFWSAHQRFFLQVVSGMGLPSAFAHMQSKIDAGESVVVQLVNTNQASQDRQLAKMKDVEESEKADSLDLSPRDILFKLIEGHFPTAMYEEKTDPDGNVIKVPAKDSKGEQVHDPEAVARKEALLTELGSLPVPENPLDQIINFFGSDNIAEVTRRKTRVVTKNGQRLIEKRTGKSTTGDIKDFENDKKRHIVFSKAGGTGQTFSSSREFKNQRKRNHYLIQAGWSAKDAIQGFGRSHRSNQASPPLYIPVTTNIIGQKRFTAAIAARLAQAGAISKGERKAEGGEMFKEIDNLSGRYAREALFSTLQAANRGEIPGFTQEGSLSQKMGIYNIEDTKVTRFLNRVLSLEIEDQNAIFGYFFDTFSSNIEAAKAAGIYDDGLETIKAERIEEVGTEIVHRDKSGAKTEIIELDVFRKNKKVPFESLNDFQKKNIYRNRRSHALWAASRGVAHRTDSHGNINAETLLTSPGGTKRTAMLLSGSWEKIDSPREDWSREVDKVPDSRKEKTYLVSGMMLPIYDRLPSSNLRIVRITTEKATYLGRLISPDDISSVRAKFGVGDKKGKELSKKTPEQVFRAVIGNGQTVVLSNGYTIKRALVSGELRIEIVGLNLYSAKAFVPHGLISERIGFKTRYFIPIAQDSGKNLLGIIMHGNIVTDVYSSSRSAPLFQPGRRGGILNPVWVAKGLGSRFADGMRLFASGVRDFSSWAKRMISEFGRSITKHLRAMWKDINAARIGGRRRGAVGFGARIRRITGVSSRKFRAPDFIGRLMDQRDRVHKERFRAGAAFVRKVARQAVMFTETRVTREWMKKYNDFVARIRAEKIGTKELQSGLIRLAKEVVPPIYMRGILGQVRQADTVDRAIRAAKKIREYGYAAQHRLAVRELKSQIKKSDIRKMRPEFKRALLDMIGGVSLVDPAALRRGALKYLREQMPDLPDKQRKAAIEDFLDGIETEDDPGTRSIYDMTPEEVRQLVGLVGFLKRASKATTVLIRRDMEVELEKESRKMLVEARKNPAVGQGEDVRTKEKSMIRTALEEGQFGLSEMSEYLGKVGREWFYDPVMEGTEKALKFKFRERDRISESLRKHGMTLNEMKVFEWLSKIGGVSIGGKHVEMTRGERLNLIGSVMDRQNTVHIMKHGFKIARRRGEEGGESFHYFPSWNDLEVLMDNMDKAEADLVRAVIESYNVGFGPAINETSVVLEGYEKAYREDTYFPRSVDLSERSIGFDGYRAWETATLDNLGFLKERIVHKRPLVMHDILSMWGRRLESAARYHGIAIPLSNIDKIIHSPGFSDAVDQNLGKQWQSFMRRRVEALASIDFSETGLVNKGIRFLQRLAVAGILGINPGSIAKQYAGIAAAAHAMNAKDLAEGIRKSFSSRRFSEIKSAMMKHSAILRDRYEGFILRLVTPVLEEQTDLRQYVKMGDIINKMMAPMQMADLHVASVIWSGKEMEVHRERPGLKGIEFEKEVARRTALAVEETQNPTTVAQQSGFALEGRREVFSMFVTAFQSASARIYSNAIWTIRKYRTGKASKNDVVKSVVMGLIGNAMIAAGINVIRASITAALASAFGGDDEREKVRKAADVSEKMAIAFLRELGGTTYLGNLTYPTVETFVRKLMGKRAFTDRGNFVSDAWGSLAAALIDFAVAAKQWSQSEKFEKGRRKGMTKAPETVRDALRSLGRGLSAVGVPRILTRPAAFFGRKALYRKTIADEIRTFLKYRPTAGSASAEALYRKLVRQGKIPAELGKRRKKSLAAFKSVFSAEKRDLPISK